MTKTIAVLLSLCILLGSCGRDKKILDLEKREKEEVTQSVKEHIDELEGELEVCSDEKTWDKIIKTQKDAKYSKLQTEHKKLEGKYNQSKGSQWKWGWKHTADAIIVGTLAIGIPTYYAIQNYRKYKAMTVIQEDNWKKHLNYLEQNVDIEQYKFINTGLNQKVSQTEQRVGELNQQLSQNQQLLSAYQQKDIKLEYLIHGLRGIPTFDSTLQNQVFFNPDTIAPILFEQPHEDGRPQKLLGLCIQGEEFLYVVSAKKIGNTPQQLAQIYSKNYWYPMTVPQQSQHEAPHE